MIADLNALDARPPRLIAVCVGNSTIQAGVFPDPIGSIDGEEVRQTPASDLEAGLHAIMTLDADQGEEPRVIAVASVNPVVSRELVERLRQRLTTRIVGVPDDLPVPIERALDAGAEPGIDRLLACAAAFAVLKQACAVVDAGTAMTVNFVDGEGTFQGGVIAPGVRMSLRALHERTAGLPDIVFERPATGAFGKNTRQAMLQGVYHGARGLVRAAVERFAEAYEAYPHVIACGGDARVLFEDDEFVDRIVPDLVLKGIAIAFRAAVGGGSDTASADGEDGH
ncbi:MAG: type III pantothenate kinase [Phycisphaerales bacterium]